MATCGAPSRSSHVKSRPARNRNANRLEPPGREPIADDPVAGVVVSAAKQESPRGRSARAARRAPVLMLPRSARRRHVEPIRRRSARPRSSRRRAPLELRRGNHDAGGIEAGIDRADVSQAADEEAAPDEERRAHGDLSHHAARGACAGVPSSRPRPSATRRGRDVSRSTPARGRRQTQANVDSPSA